MCNLFIDVEEKIYFRYLFICEKYLMKDRQWKHIYYGALNNIKEASKIE